MMREALREFARSIVGLVVIGIIAGLVLIALASLSGSRVQAQTPVVQGGFYQPVSHETLAPTSTVAVGISSAVLNPTGAGPVKACQVGPIETVSIRYWLDGTVPTSTVGHLAAIGAILQLQGYSAAVMFKVVATANTSSIPVSCAR